MEEKLKSAFQNLYLKVRAASLSPSNRLSLFLKSLFFGLSLALVLAGDFGFIYIAFFLGAAFFLYLRPLFEHYFNICSFLILVFIALAGVWAAKAYFILAVANIIIFSLLFYLILGIKDYHFIKRTRWYYLVLLGLSYYIFILFFLSDKSDWFLLKYGFTVLAVFLLMREWLAILTSFNFPKRELLVALASAFIVAQILWATALLPIGFINAANFMLLTVFITGEFLYKHFTGSISKEFLLQYLLLFAALTGLIFWTSNWALNF